MLEYLLSVGGFAVLALLAIGWLAARPRAAAPRRVLAAIVIFYTAASLRVVPWILSRPLLFGFHPFTAGDAPANRTAIVVLGSGSFTVHGRDARMGVIDVAGAARVLEAEHVYRVLGSPLIISSGGGAQGLQTETSAATMRAALVALGVPPNRIVLEQDSRTTHDEAVLVAPMLPALHVEHIVLVTSDVHMRRSLAVFRAAGMAPVPAIAPDPLNSEPRIRSFIPSSDGLRFTGSVMHEYAGLVYYFLRGWIRWP